MGIVIALRPHTKRDCLDCVFCAVSGLGTYCLKFNEHLLTNEAPDCEEFTNGIPA